MSTHTLDTASTTSPAGQHAAWHAARERDLAAEHGWLTPTSLTWLPAHPTTLVGLPGRWWADDQGAAHVAAGPADHLALRGDPVDGEARVAVDEGRSSSDLSFTAHDGTRVVVEVVRRTARTAVRVRDPRAATRAAFTGVPIAAFDPAWVIEAPVRWADAPREVVVGAAQPGLVHRVRVVGEAVVEHAGRKATLALTAVDDEHVALLFSDESSDVAPWRVVQAAARRGDATVRLDFNRAVNLPFAFSDFGTCPAPVAGNHVRFAVVAGERRPERAA